MTTAFTIFVLLVCRVRIISFVVSVDPFFSETNTRYLERIAQDVAQGQAYFAEHELVEEEE